jgi:hypothetical protein
MTHHAIPAQCKGHCCQGQGKDKVVPRTQKGQTFGKSRRAKLEGINGIRDRDLKKQLHLRKERASSRTSGKTIRLEIMKRTVRSSFRLGKMSD